MTETPITISDLATVAAIAAAVFGLVMQALKLLTDFLTAKLVGKEGSQAQSAQCRFDHQNLNALVAQQNANIAKMLDQNGKMIDAVSNVSHAAELRHQIVLAKLESLERTISN